MDILLFAMNRAQEGVLLITEDAHFSFVNETACRMLGYTQAELLGMGVPDIDPDFSYDTWSDYWKEQSTNGGHRIFESSQRTKDGRLIPVEINAYHFDYDGQSYSMCLVRDITERKQADESLLLFKALVDYSTDAIGLATPEGRHYYHNEAFDRLFGDIGNNSPECLYVDKAVVKQFLNGVMSDGSWQGEVKMFGRDGKILDISFRTYAIRNQNGSIIGLVGLHTDITGRNQGEEALKEEAAFRRTLFENSPDGILLIDPSTARFLEFNAAAHEQLGYSREEFSRLSIMDIEASETATQTKTHIAEVIKNGRADFETIQRTKQGKIRNVYVTAKNIHVGGRPVYYCVWRDITKRKRAEEALRFSEEKFLKAFNASPGIMAISTIAEGRFVDVNESFLQALGYSREELIGRTSVELGMLSSEARTAMRRAFEQNGCLRNYPFPLRRKKGDIRDCLASVEVIDVAGQKHLLFLLNDVTEHKRAEEALREREQMLSQIINNIPGRVGRLDRDFRYTFVNRQYEEKYGFLPEKMLGHTLVEVFGEDIFRQQGIPVVRKVMAGESVTYESSIKDAWGKTTYGLSTFIPEFGPDGMFRGSFIVTFDVTELKQIGERLRESQRQFIEAQRLAQLGSWEGDLLTGKLVWSEETYRIFEKDSRDYSLTYKNYLAAAHPEDRENLASVHRQALKNHQPYKVAYRLLFPDGRIKYMHEQGETFFNPEGQPLRISGFVQDITELKQAEEEKKNLAIQLTQSQKMESVGRLAGGVAHDFNNMLSVIIGTAQLAIRRLIPMDPLYKPLNDILNAAMRSADLTRQLLAFARKQTIHPKVLDLNDTIAGMLKILRRLIGENIKLIWIPGEKLWQVKMDPSQVDQLLANLTVNARDAIDQAGQVVIETSNVVCDEAYCSVHPECTPGEYILLSVSDDGCGMDKETQANIFEPFFTTKKEGQGTGLGLPTVYGIVKQNSGFIYVYSEPGQGTTFKIYLPHYCENERQAADDGQTTIQFQGGAETILIVEDEPVVMQVGKDMLETLGYRVLTASAAAQALQLVREYGEPIDLLLIDVVMPEMNGKELSEKIIAIKPGLKRLYMSGYTADVIARQGILEEGVQLISKPFFLNDLAAKVREVLES